MRVYSKNNCCNISHKGQVKLMIGVVSDAVKDKVYLSIYFCYFKLEVGWIYKEFDIELSQ